MSRLAYEFESEPGLAAILGGCVIGVTGDGYSVLTDEGETLEVARAASCFLRPEPGDEVALIRLGEDRVFIMAVTVRVAASPPILAFSQGLEILSGGRMDLTSQAPVTLNAPALETDVGEMEIKVSGFKLIGRLVNFLTENFRLFGRSVSTRAEEHNQILGSSTRLISGLDETRAANIINQAQENHITQGRDVTSSAGETMRLNGKRINIA